MCSFCSYVQVKLAHREQNKYSNSGIASTSYTLNTMLRVTLDHSGHAKSPVFLQQGYKYDDIERAAAHLHGMLDRAKRSKGGKPHQ